MIMTDIKTIDDPILGKLVPAQAPAATFLSDEDDFDLALYVDGPAMLMKLELDWPSRLNPGSMIEIEKEFAVGNNYLEAFGRPALIAKFEEVYDVVSNEQMSFVGFAKRVEIRNSVMKLLEEYFEKLDAGVFDSIV